MKMKRKEKQRMRRFSALFLSLMLICALSMTAFATEAENNTVSSEPNPAATETEGGKTVAASTHSYTAYQIFAGEYDKESGKLSNIEWGANAKDSEIQDAIAKALGLSAGAPLADILTALGNVGDETATANQLAAAIASMAGKLGTGESVQNGSTVKPGYYIVIDTTENIGSGDSRSFALLQCIDGTIKINAKTGTVTSDKKVKDMNDSDVNDPTNDVLDTSADYDIGDKVPFELTGTVAENFELFQGPYKFVFHDTESKGLTFNNDVTVTIDGTQITSGYRVDTTPGDGETFQVIFDDLKQISGVHAKSVIKISYTSTLNKDAVIGAAGNENKMYLEYSNNPSGGDETGQTPEKKVIVFTYKVEINKIDQDKKPLKGAGFALYKVDNNSDNQWNGRDASDTKNYKLVASYDTDSEMTTFSFEGIDDGEYLLVETKTPAGYNSIEPVSFTVTAGHANGALTTLNGNPIAGSVQLTFTPDAGSGTLGTDVVNKSGSLLPSTGGIGTTMFYIIGGVLMVGACMMLFVRKIMTNEKR